MNPSTGGPSAAELYFALHAGTPGDAAFYVNEVRGANSVVELGCGDGRLTLALAEHVDRIVGVDRDEAALGLARAQQDKLAQTAHSPEGRVTWVQQDMCELELNERFDRVLIPFNAIFYLEGDALKRRCFDRAREHLNPGGSLLLDVYGIDLLLEDAEGLDPSCEPIDDEFDRIAGLGCGGFAYDVFERNVWWPSRSRLEVNYEFRPSLAGGPSHRQAIMHSYCSLLTLAALAEDAGFTCEMGTFQLAEDDAPQQWLRATV